ncbi:MAG TPA: hypothetical protein VGP43_11100 [Chitinophagaceae bacterium]|nr:hypothetical protein [Chitinophagaceae bacterium]
MKYKNIREEELKNKVGSDWFKSFDTTEILGNVDFTVFPKQDNIFGRTPLLWAEAKTGNFDVPTMFVQLVLTIGKARTFDKTLPPAFLGAFDFKKIAFVPYISIQDLFYINDFNWNVAPSNHDTKEFKLIKNRIEATLKQNTYVYDYQIDEKDLKTFIANNIAKATEASKIKIDKNNFIPIYLRWLDIVKPVIDVNWDDLKKASILNSDFYLADLFVDDKDTNKIEDDASIRDNLFVIFQNQGYKIEKENIKQMFDATINIRNKETYLQFWKRYKRPPIKEFLNYIIERRDLLVPQDIRERKGAFFTPRQWVELSQKYLSDLLGENWQEEYYIWDCGAGTGNLLTGLTNKYNIWASTLDQADVKVMHDRIKHGAILLENHVFQFDFLNDDFSKLPQGLQDILNDENKRKKLIIYINPPYAEGDTHSENKIIRKGVANSKIYEKYKSVLGEVVSELFIQFLGRIYKEIPDCTIGTFSTLKYLNSPKSAKFRTFFKAKAEKGFITIGNSFDNVIGNFPIGFIIWNLKENKEVFQSIECEVYDKTGNYIGNKSFTSYDNKKFLNDWLKLYYDRKNEKIGVLGFVANDFQNQKLVFITTNGRGHHETYITHSNLVEILIYFSLRHCFGHTWINHNDQFLFPNETWKKDIEFHNDCLTFSLFYEKNQIRATEGVNHWIPFTESEVNSKEKFESNFMSSFIKGKIKSEEQADSLFGNNTASAFDINKPRQFSAEATEVFNAGRELWIYYHLQENVNVNASLYDIREYFQGRNDKGRMNARSTDKKYTDLIGNLRQKLNLLSDKIEPKVYEYEFLIR